MRKGTLLISLAAALCAALVQGQTRPPTPKAPTTTATSATQRAFVDQYRVPCPNDSLKTAKLSLEKLDLTTAGDHAELWEKVIRKLRAGVMPPAGIRRAAPRGVEGVRGVDHS